MNTHHRRDLSSTSTATSVSPTSSTPPLPPSTSNPRLKSSPFHSSSQNSAASPAYYSAINPGSLGGNFGESPKGSISRSIMGSSALENSIENGKAGTPPVDLNTIINRKPAMKEMKSVVDSDSSPHPTASKIVKEAFTPKLPRKIKESFEKDPRGEKGDRDLLGKYKPQQARSTKSLSHNMGTMSRVNFSDALKRVAMVLHQHIMKIERRYTTRTNQSENTGLFHTSKLEMFSEDRYAMSGYRCQMVRVAGVGGIFSVKEVKKKMNIPESKEIYEFMYR
ncbi:hypothetical protein TL16_g10327 [Triparma laevis f. inornata]|uniref:Uncharacterized protein n=1 Tax=Triparma laevis f. inornata TaxID=1714386 RepID=A0A9W7B8D3_9STRA|nr:hypothetical protein TL16_g10327 [Triparma laevis f. inornata]